jgi:hypothetical protein
MADAKASSFVAASALAWLCLLKFGSVGVAGAQHIYILFFVEYQSRLTPPLRNNGRRGCGSFGNQERQAHLLRALLKLSAPPSDWHSDARCSSCVPSSATQNEYSI